MIRRKIQCSNLFLISGLEPGRTLLLSVLFDHGVYTQKPSVLQNVQDRMGSQQRTYRDTTGNVGVTFEILTASVSVEFYELNVQIYSSFAATNYCLKKVTKQIRQNNV